ncbi:MAG: hypothetical protein IKN91_01315 [Paludibacteraceae bacterium]|nr:hypothetical protein [Paludibacteraceae bacterium]
MAEKVLQDFKDNGFWIADPQPNGKILIKRTCISQQQYDAAIKELNKKGNNGLNK